jgi:hypothetical protein
VRIITPLGSISCVVGTTIERTNRMTLGSPSPKLGKNKKIADLVSKRTKEGVSVKDIVGEVQASYADAPKSLNTFYKYYKTDLDAARAEIAGEIGSLVVKRAKYEGEFGHFPSQELFLRSKAGWSPTSTNIEVEQDSVDEDLSAIDQLAELLGIQEDEDSTDT